MNPIAYHNSQGEKDKAVTNARRRNSPGKRDRMCMEALRRGYIKADPESGRAWSARFHGKEMGSINKLGYKVFTLHIDGKRAQIKFHRLIWIAAFGEIPEGLVIDHINRKKPDNRINNLCLVDTKGNAVNRRSYKGASNPAAKINERIAECIRDDYMRNRNIMAVSKKYGISHSQASNIIHGRCWT